MIHLAALAKDWQIAARSPEERWEVCKLPYERLQHQHLLEVRVAADQTS